MANRLAHETSPYLLQHKDNLVEWYPWGDEALARARAESKPIFLSVGYSTCHWCHVMAHESFDDEQTAAFLNEHFVCIKVDREERPDIDSIYMRAVQALTGRGGWPMSVWLLPDGRPFYGGTYFPCVSSYGMPSFLDVLRLVLEVFHSEDVRQDAENLTRAIEQRVTLGDGSLHAQTNPDVLDVAFQGIAAQYEPGSGGFNHRPKFPPSMTLEFLLRLYSGRGWRHALDMVLHTLDRMACGGIHDQLGGGFHRYSVDDQWLIPHFEKMLYDNALLLRIYLHAYQVSGREYYRRVVDGIVGYLAREMLHPQGGFYSAQDADSDGHEGAFFVWSAEEIRGALQGSSAIDAVLDYWGVAGGSNFEDRNVLWVPENLQEVAARHQLDPLDLRGAVEKARAVLFDLREKRVRPGRDEKILASWNGLAINSLAQVARVLEREDALAMASRAADFVLSAMLRDGRLMRSFKDGQAKYEGYLEDYAFFSEGLIELYQTTFDPRWLAQAQLLTETMVDLFWDEQAGFYDTAWKHEKLIVRPQELADNAIPSGTSSAVAVLLRMSIFSGRSDWRELADRLLQHLTPAIERYPLAFSYLASQLDFATSQPHEVALAGDPVAEDTIALLKVVRQPYRPNQVVALHRPGEKDDQTIPLLQGRGMIDGKAAAYVCRNFVCLLPTTDPVLLQERLRQSQSSQEA